MLHTQHILRSTHVNHVTLSRAGSPEWPSLVSLNLGVCGSTRLYPIGDFKGLSAEGGTISFASAPSESAPSAKNQDPKGAPPN